MTALPATVTRVCPVCHLPWIVLRRKCRTPEIHPECRPERKRQLRRAAAQHEAMMRRGAAARAQFARGA